MERLGEEEEERATERKREYTDLGHKIASRLPWLILGLGNDRRGTSEGRDVSKAIISVSGSESFASLTNRFFHFRRPPGFRMAFDAIESNGRSGHNQCHKSKESSDKDEVQVEAMSSKCQKASIPK